MSKHWTPRKPTVVLRPAQRPSRIRRDPVRLEPALDPVKAEANALEREMRGGVAGVLLFAAALAVLVIGISAATIFHDDPGAAARAARFGQCYNADGPNCVVDGGTISIGGKTVAIAGIEAPQIQGARCADERAQGIEAAVRLVDLLNSGNVTVSTLFRDPYGRMVRKVRVGGDNVGKTLINAGVAREY
ncbi:MAG: thermonuclease family protein, partial [Sphingomicrobium sp.]